MWTENIWYAFKVIFPAGVVWTDTKTYRHYKKERKYTHTSLKDTIIRYS